MKNIQKIAKEIFADVKPKKGDKFKLNWFVRPFIFQMTDNSIGLKLPKKYEEEVDLMEDLIKKRYKSLKLTQISDVGTKPIEIEIKTKQQKSFISDLKNVISRNKIDRHTSWTKKMSPIQVKIVDGIKNKVIYIIKENNLFFRLMDFSGLYKGTAFIELKGIKTKVKFDVDRSSIIKRNKLFKESILQASNKIKLLRNVKEVYFDKTNSNLNIEIILETKNKE